MVFPLTSLLNWQQVFAFHIEIPPSPGHGVFWTWVSFDLKCFSCVWLGEEVSKYSCKYKEYHKSSFHLWIGILLLKNLVYKGTYRDRENDIFWIVFQFLNRSYYNKSNPQTIQVRELNSAELVSSVSGSSPFNSCSKYNHRFSKYSQVSFFLKWTTL